MKKTAKVCYSILRLQTTAPPSIKPPSSLPVSSPSVHVQPQQFAFYLRLKLCAWVSVQPLDPLASSTSHVERQRSFCGLMPTWCVLPELSPPPAAMPSECQPIVLSAPAPFFVVTLRRYFASVGLTCPMFPYHLRIRFQQLLGLTFQLLTALGRASHEALEAHSLDSTFYPLGNFDSDSL
jgi:hypothetical protein